MTATGFHIAGVHLLLRSLPVLGIDIALGAASSLWIAGTLMPAGLGIADRAMTWLIVMGGPIVGTAWGMAEFHPAILLGWLGLLMIPAHPCHPHPATGCVTLLGF